MTVTWTGSPPRCDWQMGTAFTGPRDCGRPAKFAVAPIVGVVSQYVCGIHARKARRWNRATLPLIKHEEATP
jgi:hypothetical protein